MDTIRYIIVVHGIGEQRKNETVLSVVNRFAEIRAKTSPKKIFEILTLGKATGQTGKDRFLDPCRFDPPKSDFIPWMEFEGIPQIPSPNQDKLDPFYGERSESGSNLRFVDLCWADIMQQDYPHVGQKIEDWAQGLVGRLKRKDQHEKDNKLPRNPGWVLKILEQLAETLIFVRRLLSFRVKKVEDMVYNQFLGDVQLYGEYPRTRGRAVRRFHKLMWLIHTKHRELEEEKQKKDPTYKKADPEYTILAHSLGTVMSMDALLYALVDDEIRKEKKKIDAHPELPFPGYWISKKEMDEIETYESFVTTEESKDKSQQNEKKLIAVKRNLKDLNDKVEFLNTEWIKNVDSFITLGSPIDKFLVLWWLNYSYLKSPNWGNGWNRSGERIKHFNYTDEQDPVGHELNKFRETHAFNSIFTKEEDRVYNRYVWPGYAHVKYWKDWELFQHIAHKAIDTTGTNPTPKKVQWFKKWVYIKNQIITYFLVPLVITIATTFTVSWTLNAENWYGRFVGGLFTFAVFVLGLRVIHLLLLWRQVMREKAYRNFVTRQSDKQKEWDEKQEIRKKLKKKLDGKQEEREKLKKEKGDTHDVEKEINEINKELRKADKKLKELEQEFVAFASKSPGIGLTKKFLILIQSKFLPLIFGGSEKQELSLRYLAHNIIFQVTISLLPVAFLCFILFPPTPGSYLLPLFIFLYVGFWVFSYTALIYWILKFIFDIRREKIKL